MSALLHATMRVNLPHVMLNARSQTQKRICCVVWFIWSPKHELNQTIVFRDGRTIRESKEVLSIKVRRVALSGGRGVGWGEEGAIWAGGNVLSLAWVVGSTGVSLVTNFWAECFSFYSLFCTYVIFYNKIFYQKQPGRSYNEKQMSFLRLPPPEGNYCFLVSLERVWSLFWTSPSVTFYNPFHFCKVSSNVSASIPDFNNLGLLTFFLGQSC